MIELKKAINLIDSLRSDIDEETTVSDLLNALEDGECLAGLGLTDSDTDTVDEVYGLLEQYRHEDVLFALDSIEARLRDEHEDAIKEDEELFILERDGHDIDIECLTKTEFCGRFGIDKRYDDWRAAGGQIDDVLDCTKDDAIATFIQWLKDGEIDQQTYQTCCRVVTGGVYASTTR